MDNFDLDILSHHFSVVFESPSEWSETGMGRSSLLSQTIRINSDMPKDAILSTLIHEIIHMILELNSIESSESQIDAISLGFFTLMKNNPGFASLYASK